MEIVAARGKKKTNRKEQIELLSELLTISNDHGLGPGMAIKIKFAIIAALFDYNPKLSDAMKPDSWEKCMAGVDSLLDMMEQHETVVTTGELIMEENEVLDVEPYKIRGCYLTAVERLDEEFIKVGENLAFIYYQRDVFRMVWDTK
jgi:translation initiation factor 3 subunit C